MLAASFARANLVAWGAGPLRKVTTRVLLLVVLVLTLIATAFETPVLPNSLHLSPPGLIHPLGDCTGGVPLPC